VYPAGGENVDIWDLSGVIDILGGGGRSPAIVLNADALLSCGHPGVSPPD
jgi:hypothetical protein